MKCKAARQALEDAEHQRDDAQVHAVIAAENAQFIVLHSDRLSFDWAAVRKALRDVRLWEARCNGAEVALAECVDNARRDTARRKVIDRIT